jgi:hypothetical protein
LKLASEPEDGIAPVRKFMETLLHVLKKINTLSNPLTCYDHWTNLSHEKALTMILVSTAYQVNVE